MHTWYHPPLAVDALLPDQPADAAASDHLGNILIPRSVPEATLGVRGAKIFNLLPVWIRTINGASVDKFKAELDMFLVGVPDQPTVPGRQRAAASNSLLDQLQLIF